METCDDNTTPKVERASSTSRSQHRQQRGVTPPRSSSARSGDRIKGRHEPNPTATAPAPTSCISGGGTTGRSAITATQAATQRSARSAGTAASFSSSRDGRGLQIESESGRGTLFSARTTSRSLTSNAASLTRCSTDTPRETSRTTTTMTMSTARAEATLVVLEAERAQLEHRLKKVEDELRQEQLLTMKENRKRGRRHAAR